MRNPSRIYPLLNKIGAIWIKHPDMRLGQLIENIRRMDKINIYEDNLFYIEDEKFEKLIDKLAKTINMSADRLIMRKRK